MKSINRFNRLNRFDRFDRLNSCCRRAYGPSGHVSVGSPLVRLSLKVTDNRSKDFSETWHA